MTYVTKFCFRPAALGKIHSAIRHLWHHNAMRKWPVATVLALVLLVSCTLPASCLGPRECAPAHSSCHTPPGCPAHHRQSSMSDHSCCHAGRAPEMAKQPATRVAPSVTVRQVLSTGSVAELPTGLTPLSLGCTLVSSPPAVLRI
jgi:hypothetical protein